jgi:hypothetical protein
MMTTASASDSTPYGDLVEVPIGTFRHYVTFIVKHNLWDEATSALQAAGTRGVVLGGPHVQVIREFVEAKGAELNKDPEHAGALVVPECSILCPQPQVPHGGGTPPDGGTGSPEGGTADAGTLPQ